MAHRPAHDERHFGGSFIVRDVVIGMSDGLTVPFALAAGLSGAVGSAHLVVIGGLAELAAGAISMGLGGYLAGKSEVDHYAAERQRERREVSEVPAEEAKEVATVFRGYGLSEPSIDLILVEMKQRPEQWVDFMMRFELGLERPDPRRALVDAAIIGGAYALGGSIPLAPYVVAKTLHGGLVGSVIVTLLALLVFGFVKGRLTGASPIRGAIQTLIIGGIAAAAAFGLARAIA